MQFSHSRLECFNSCPYKFKLRYIEGLKTLPTDDPASPLILGHALHTGIEQGTESGVAEYLNSYPVITDEHINEQIKLEFWIPKVRKLIDPEARFEVPIYDPDFIGFIDLIQPVLGFHNMPEPNVFDLVDFKYASSASRYADSEQLHLYKYYFEKHHPGQHIRKLTYWIIPKVQIKQKKDEDLDQFRNRIQEELEKKELEQVEVTYDPDKVITFMTGVKRCIESVNFPEKHGYLCNWCEYQEYCEKGKDYMILPQNTRRSLDQITKRVIWIYGSPFSGKTWFANKFSNPLMLNTDGNIKYVDAPFVPIRDEVTVNGRLTNTKLGWQIFKEVIDELSKKQNEFNTIIVDLLEDTYEMCRLYMYQQMGITHESDDAFRAWDKVRTEFLSTIRKLINLDYENIILISHADTSRDITKKGGDKITAIKPNIQDKVANKIAGMVDVVARVIAEGDNRVLSFKTSETVFGGGRLIIEENEIPLELENFLEVYDEANRNAVAAMTTKAEKPDVNPAGFKDTGTGTITGASPEELKEEESKQEEAAAPRTRKRKNPDEELAKQVKEEEIQQREGEAVTGVEPNSGEVLETRTTATPVRRTRKVRE